MLKQQPQQTLTILHVSCIGVAAVQLHHVNAPCCKRLRILLQVELASWVAPTCLGSKILVYAKLQALGVDLQLSYCIYFVIVLWCIVFICNTNKGILQDLRF